MSKLPYDHPSTLKVTWETDDGENIHYSEITMKLLGMSLAKEEFLMICHRLGQNDNIVEGIRKS